MRIRVTGPPTGLLFSLLLWLLSGTVVCHAQAVPTWAWAQQVASLSGATDGSVATDGAGNVYLCSSFYPTGRLGSVTISTQGAEDIYLAKFNAQGALQWVQSFGGGSTDRARYLATDPAGQVYLTGAFDSPTIRFGPHTLTNHGGSDCFLIKVDAQGQVLWARNPGSPANEWCGAVAVDGYGNVFLTGSFDGNLRLGTTQFVSRGLTDTFVARYDAQGNAQWAQQLGGAGYDAIPALAVAPTGEVTLAAHLDRPGGYIGGQQYSVPGFADMFVVRYNTWGVLQWVHQTQASGQAFGSGVACDAAGHSYVTGNFQGRVTFGPTQLNSQGDMHFFLARYDAAGNVRWVRSAQNRLQSGRGQSVAVDAAGRTYVAGQFTAPQFVLDTITLRNATATATSGDPFVAVFDSLGRVQWALRTGGAEHDYPNTIALDGRGRAYLNGLFARVTTIGPTPMIGQNVTYSPYMAGWLACLDTGFVPPAAPPLPPPVPAPPPPPLPPPPPVEPPVARFLPNIITPNGDGQNDTLRLRGVEAAELSIFNRWGKRVYYAAPYAQDWTAPLQPAGLYYYLLRTRSGEQLRGWVEVVK